jgi:hypothetical protein
VISKDLFPVFCVENEIDADVQVVHLGVAFIVPSVCAADTKNKEQQLTVCYLHTRLLVPPIS